MNAEKHASCTALHTYNMYMAEIDTQKHTETHRQTETETDREEQRQTETDTSIEYIGSTHNCICKTACADLQNI